MNNKFFHLFAVIVLGVFSANAMHSGFCDEFQQVVTPVGAGDARLGVVKYINTNNAVILKELHEIFSTLDKDFDAVIGNRNFALDLCSKINKLRDILCPANDMADDTGTCPADGLLDAYAKLMSAYKGFAQSDVGRDAGVKDLDNQATGPRYVRLDPLKSAKLAVMEGINNVYNRFIVWYRFLGLGFEKEQVASIFVKCGDLQKTVDLSRFAMDIKKQCSWMTSEEIRDCVMGEFDGV